MKTVKPFLPERSKRLLSILVYLLVATVCFGQAAQPTVFARVVFHKVTPGQEGEFEKLIKENIRPMVDWRKQQGQITGWRFIKVHFTGADAPYQYASITYFDSWAKTEAKSVGDLVKASNPKADIPALTAKFAAVRKSAGEAIYYREDFVVGKNAPASKYYVLDFMKIKDNLFEEYLKVEKEDWKPVHQILSDDAKRTGWALWARVMPGGSSLDHEYVTSNGYATYEQIPTGNYEEAFKKAHPGKNTQEYMNRAIKTRDQVRSELWEVVDSL